MLEYIDFISAGAMYVPHLYIRADKIVSVSGLEPAECLHTFETTPSVDGAIHNTARFDQRRVRVEFELPLDYYLINNQNSSDGKAATKQTNLYNLRKLDFKGASKLNVKVKDADSEREYYLYNTRIERVSYPTIGDAQQNVIIDFISEESNFCMDEGFTLIWSEAPDPNILLPGAVRGDGIEAIIKLTGTAATVVKLRIWKFIEGAYEEMTINVGAGSNRELYIDTRFGQKKILLNNANYINHLTYDSKWLKVDCESPYVYALPGATSADPNYYIDYAHSTFGYESSHQGVAL